MTRKAPPGRNGGAKFALNLPTPSRVGGQVLVAGILHSKLKAGKTDPANLAIASIAGGASIASAGCASGAIGAGASLHADVL